jgi:hypothetical protein
VARVGGHAGAARDAVGGGNVDVAGVDEHRAAAAAEAAPEAPAAVVRDRRAPQAAASGREHRGAGSDECDPTASFEQHRATS